MTLVRTAAERLLALLFWSVRSALLGFALVVATMLVAAGALGESAAPPWVGTLTRACLAIGATLVVTLVLPLVAPGPPHATGESAGEEAPPWLWLLGLALVALPAVVAG